MANGKDIAWKPIIACSVIGLIMFTVGALAVGPTVYKRKVKKLAAKKKKASEKETMKKAA